jgi:2-polyprenyl-6-methoxyphenol hydroxylase-like FAD-dependent oxidoreductase
MTGVVVAGAGPTGLLLAGDLATAGVPVTVAEKRPQGLSNLTRAFGVHARTLELLDARRLADELVTTGQVIHELRLFGAVPFDIARLDYRAAYPVRADEVGRPQRLPVTHLHRHAVVVLLDPGNFGAVTDFGSCLLGAAQQQALDLVLRRDEQERVSRSTEMRIR